MCTHLNSEAAIWRPSVLSTPSRSWNFDADCTRWDSDTDCIVAIFRASHNEFSVIVHELAHELLHRGDQRPASKTVRETEAEAVAFVVCQAIGLETGSAGSDYIQFYDGKPETLASSLDRIQQVAAGIIPRL